MSTLSILFPDLEISLQKPEEWISGFHRFNAILNGFGFTNTEDMRNKKSIEQARRQELAARRASSTSPCLYLAGLIKIFFQLFLRLLLNILIQ